MMSESKRVTNPFPGLRPFETDEYRLFFGREGQSDALIARLQRSHFLAVVGTSGSGKSSLVRAGLLPALRGGMMAGAGSGWRISIMRPGSDPFGNLAHSLADQDVLPEAGGGLPPAEAEAVIEATLRSGSLGLVDAAKHARLAEHEKLLVVVDQFEELFRFRAARAATSTGDEASAFVKLMLEAAQQREFSLYVVLTMRSDFLGDCAQFQGLPEAINDGQYLIPRMTRDERRFAITGPVGVTRGKITEPLVNRLMNDVGDNPDQLPILQHALMRTWDYWAAHRRDGEPLGLEHYQKIGTMADALSLHADEAWDELPDERSRRMAEKLFKALTEKGADNREIRRPTRLSEIAATAEVTEVEVVAVIDVFRREGRSFLMPPAGDALHGETVIDISHESLIRNWDRLQKWVEEEAQSARIYRRLAEAAVLHQQASEGLLQDPALQIALDWREKSQPNAAWAGRYHSDFAGAMTFLDQSKAAHEADIAAKERQRQEQLARERRELEMARDFAEKQAHAARRLRWLTAGMAVMFLLAIVTAGYAVIAKRSVEREKEKVAKLLDETERKRKEIASTLQDKEEAERARVVADKERAAADIEKKKALDKALAEEQLAKKEADRANTQAAIAIANRKQIVAAVNRSELRRQGTQAFRRGKFKEARGFFEDLRADLARLQPSATTPNGLRPEEARQYQEDYGWTLSNIGATHQKEDAFEDAIEPYEKALDVFSRVFTTDSDDPILFDTYDGLANSYFAVFVGVRLKACVPTQGQTEEQCRRIQAAKDFERGEVFRRHALDFQGKHRPLEVADGYLNFARLYQESGRYREAEETFKQGIELLRKENNQYDIKERAALASAQKELAELYLLQDRSDDALMVLNQMVVLQEDVTVPEIAEQGQQIASGYSDLGELYQAKRDAKTREAATYVKPEDADRKQKAEQEAAVFKRKAENADYAANMLQRAGLKLRRAEKYQGTMTDPEWVRQAKDLTADLDGLGDAYVRLGKYPDAEAIYVTGLSYRKESNVDVWKSLDKLAKFYRETMKNFAKAEEYHKLLIKFYEDKPWGTEYAAALMQIGAFYAEAPNRSADAESNYRSALKIYQKLDDWWYQDVVLYRLSKIYENQQRVTEREQALRDRVDTLTRYVNQLNIPTGPQPKDPVTLMSEYLHALNALAYFYTGAKNDAAAEVAYQRADTAFDYITSKIVNQKILKFYADTLKDYSILLKKLNKQAKADEVAAKEKVVRTTLRQYDQLRAQQDVGQQTQQGPAPATAPE